MNEFDNFVNEREKAIKRAENHIADLRKMENIPFMNVEQKKEKTDTEKNIDAYMFLAYVESHLKLNVDVQERAKLILGLAENYKKVINEN